MKHLRISGMLRALTALVPVLLLSCPDPIADLSVKSNCIITFDTHGGTEILPKYFTLGSEVYPQSFSTQRDGHTLIGWFDAESGGSRFGGNAGREKIPVDRNLVFHAQWGIGGHMVRFETQGGAEVPPVQIPHDGLLFPSAYASTRPAQGFAGWWNESGSTQYREPFPVTEDITLYAHWTAGHITVQFVSSGGSAIHAVALRAGNSLDLSSYVPVKAQSGFAGWYTDEACTTPNKVSSVTAGAQDITLYAKWEIGSHTVSFNTPGGSTVPSLLVTHGETLNPASYVSFKEGYGFAGWFMQDKTTPYTAPFTVTSDLTLYAVWDYGYHTVNFVTGSGAAPVHPIRVQHGGAIDPSAYISSKPGCGFAGWWNQESGGTRYSGTITINNDLTLYTQWDTSKWTVSFNTHGGTVVADIQLSQTYNQLNVDAITAMRPGCAFKGWFSAETGGTQYSGTAFAVTRNMTMHAQWETARFFVVPDGALRYLGDAIITYKNGTSISVTVDTSGAVRLKSGSWSNTGTDTYETFQPDGGSPFLIGRRVDSGTVFLRISTDKILKLRDPSGGFIPIGSHEEFQLISGKRDGKYKQEADIDFLGDKGRLWEPLSDYANKFTGSFDGGGRNIYNLKIEKNENYASIFGYVSGGPMNDIHVESGSVTSTADVIGAICGNFNSSTVEEAQVIRNCSNKASVSGGTNVGGITGYCYRVMENCANYGTITGTGDKVGGLTGGSLVSITNCQNAGTVSGGNMVGGIVGEYSGNSRGALSGSSNTGTITGTGEKIGGLVGSTRGDSRINGDSYNTGAVSGTSKVGGIIGNSYSASISNTYNTGTIQATGDYAGGIAGYGSNGGGVFSSENRATGAVTGQNFIGGIAGSSDGFAFNGCTNKAAVVGISKTGGITGEITFNGYIANCFNEAAITGTGDYTGGLVGFSDQIAFSNSGNKTSGTVQGINYAGGIAGVAGRSVINNCYNQAAITATGNYSGGLAGSIYGNGVMNQQKPGASIKDGSYNTGAVQGVDYVGGLAGEISGECANITGCYNQGTVTGTGNFIGGLAGSHKGPNAKITGSHNQGAVTGAGDKIGGLAGVTQTTNYGTIENCYNQGTVKGTNYVGGLAGLSTGLNATITTSYNEGTIIATGNNAGGLVGVNAAGAIITGSTNKASGAVSGVIMVSGVAGSNSESTISDCNNSAPITGTHSRIAGIAGYTYKGSISNCSNSGRIENTGTGPATVDSAYFQHYVGGIAGDGAGPVSGSHNSGVVYNPGGAETGGVTGSGNNTSSCNNSGPVTGGAQTGGVVGSNYGLLTACNNAGTVQGDNGAGGVAGNNAGTITGCYNTTAINASNDNAGGVAGVNSKGGTIRACYNTGPVVIVRQDAGGIVGWNGGNIVACYNTGTVQGETKIGGVCGNMDAVNGASNASIVACYSTGTVTGNSNAGGVIGVSYSGTSTACYWSGNAVNGVGGGSGTHDAQKFANGVWPETGSGTGKHAQWGEGDGSNNNKWWGTTGGWNSGNPQYPKLYFE